MKPRLFYVMWDQKVRGPFPEDGILELAREGGIPPGTQVSLDQRKWFPLEVIFPGSSRAANIPDPSGVPISRQHQVVAPVPPPLASSKTDLFWFAKQRGVLVGAAVACGLVVLVGVALVFSLSKSPREMRPTDSRAETRNDPPPVAPPDVATGDAQGTGDSKESTPGTTVASEPQAPSDKTEDHSPRWIDQVRKASGTVLTDKGQGSGFFIKYATHGFLFVTNSHVVEDASAIQIRLHDGTIVGVSRGTVYPQFDLSLLAVDNLQDPPAVLPLRADVPELAERVYAYGAPLGLTGTITEGIVSGIRTTEEMGNPSNLHGVPNSEMRWVQTSAPISRGNSGGPLADAQGRVVGVNTWGFVKAQNLNFAVSAEQVLALLPQADLIDLPGPRSLPSPNENAISDSALATARYWLTIKTAMQVWHELSASSDEFENMSPREQKASLRVFAGSCLGMVQFLENLEDANVDPAAVHCKDAICDLVKANLETLASLEEDDDPAALGAAITNLALTQAKLATVEQTARMELRAKYGVQFPSLLSDDE